MTEGIHLVMGIGGFEEGVMAAVAAKALGAVAEARGWCAEAKVCAKYRETWKIDDLVPGKKEDLFISISSITGDNKWFDLQPVLEKEAGHEVSTLTVSEDGVNIEKRIHH